MRQPVLALRGYFNVMLVDIAARRAGRTPALTLGALLAAALLLAAAIGLRPAGNTGPVRDAALSAQAAGGAAASAAQIRSGQAEIGLREYLSGEGPTLAAGGAAASAAGVRPAHVETGLREYLPGEAASGSESHASAVGGLLEYLPGERPALATAAHGGAGPLEYLPGEAPAGVGGTVVPLVGPQP